MRFHFSLVFAVNITVKLTTKRHNFLLVELDGQSDKLPVDSDETVDARAMASATLNQSLA